MSKLARLGDYIEPTILSRLALVGGKSNLPVIGRLKLVVLDAGAQPQQAAVDVCEHRADAVLVVLLAVDRPGLVQCATPRLDLGVRRVRLELAGLLAHMVVLEALLRSRIVEASVAQIVVVGDQHLGGVWGRKLEKKI